MHLKDEGQSIEEAAADTEEMFASSGYDLSHVWVCRDQGEREEKEGAQRCLEQVRMSGLGKDSYLNASFSLGKLRQVCKRHQSGSHTGK